LTDEHLERAADAGVRAFLGAYADIAELAVSHARNGTSVMHQLSDILAAVPHPKEPRTRDCAELKRLLVQPDVDAGSRHLPPRMPLLDGEDLRMVAEAEPNWLNGVINKLRYQGRSTEVRRPRRSGEIVPAGSKQRAIVERGG